MPEAIVCEWLEALDRFQLAPVSISLPCTVHSQGRTPFDN